ncbi:MAG: hypothetical protein CM1200mP12_08440 [Gammaproteobacteria bacterium]|nr:MAG: hypothetical protein CM1200mP12_08440 [Gammaproteobacteria bacterium]
MRTILENKFQVDLKDKPGFLVPSGVTPELRMEKYILIQKQKLLLCCFI